jgi:tetratricopeptide (TPR) repeat protein
MQEQLMSDQPGDVQLQCDLSDTWNALGTVLSSLRRYREARPYFRQAFDARQALVAGEPESREYQRKLANILMNMGVVSNETGDLPAARSQMQAAQSLRERLLVGEPDSEDVRRDLAKGYFNLGRIGLTWRASAAASEDTDAFLEYDRMSRDCLDRAIEQFERLPTDSAWALSDQYLLATSYHLRGRATWESERAAEAHSLYEQALTRMQTLVEANPDVHKYRGALARIHLDHGLLHAGQDEQESSEMLDAAQGILKPLVEDYPDETDYRAVLATALLELGKLRCRCDCLDAATSVLCQSAEHSRQLLDRLPDRPEYQRMHRQTLDLLAEVAEISLDRGTLEMAGECIQRGLHLNPDNERFLQLQQRLQTGLAGAREE